MKRRGFLKLSAGGALVFGLSGGALTWFFAGYRSKLGANDRPIGLSTKEFAVAKALVETLLPAEDGFVSGESLGLVQRLDEEVWAATPKLRSDLKNGFQVLEHAPSFMGFDGRFTSLSREARLKFYNGCLIGENDLLRQLAVGLKQMIHFFYYSRPETWANVGYPGPFVPNALPHETHFAYAELLKKERRS